MKCRCDGCNRVFDTPEYEFRCSKCDIFSKETAVTPNDSELRVRIYREAFKDEFDRNAELEKENARLREENERLVAEIKRLKDFYSSFEKSYGKMVGRLNKIQSIVEQP